MSVCCYGSMKDRCGQLHLVKWKTVDKSGVLWMSNSCRRKDKKKNISIHYWKKVKCNAHLKL